MDIWVVAAAAGAGYVAQHCKNLVKGKRSFSDDSPACESPNFRPGSSSSTQRVEDKNACPCDVVHCKRLDKEVVSERERLSLESSMVGIAFTSCEDVEVNREGVGICDDKDETDGDLSLLPSSREMSVSYGFSKKKNNLRSRRTNGQSIKPLNSMESCLMAQLYKQQAEMEEHTFSSISSPCTPIVRPFVGTDGSQIISRGTGNSCSLLIKVVQNNPHAATSSEDIFGVPRLPSLGSMEIHGKPKTDVQMKQQGRFTHTCGVKGKHQRLQGSSHGALLFCLGLSLGLISSFLTNKQEVEKLNDLLKQTEGLVQDLQDELEMKDSLTVKELAVEDSESQDTQNDAFQNWPVYAFSPEQKLNDYDNVYNDQKAEGESFSKIEAELEAELERLEINMSSCRLDRKISNLVELDADYVAEGELKAEAFARQSGPQPYADRDGSGSSTTHSVHYAVSPRELTLRLQEIVQSRLEKRVQELEIALQNSQRKVRNMESHRTSYLRELSESELACCLTEGSPVVKETNQSDQPVVINLSGEALDAYNEAYDEFTKMNDLEERDTPYAVKDSHKQEILQTSEQEGYWLRNSEVNYEGITDKTPSAFSMQQVGEDDYYLSNGMISSRDENDIGDDDVEELLIKHIVEQARKGSPIVLNAQRALFSLDENGHS